jgi:hypothetical protein
MIKWILGRVKALKEKVKALENGGLSEVWNFCFLLQI